MSLLWLLWATVGGFGQECTQPCGHYPFDLGSSWSNKRIQEVTPKLSLNPLDPFGHVAVWRMDRPDCAGVAFMGRKEKHAQEWSRRYLEFPGKAFIILPQPPIYFGLFIIQEATKRNDFFLRIATFRNQSDILRCVD